MTVFLSVALLLALSVALSVALLVAGLPVILGTQGQKHRVHDAVAGEGNGGENVAARRLACLQSHIQLGPLTLYREPQWAKVVIPVRNDLGFPLRALLLDISVQSTGAAKPWVARREFIRLRSGLGNGPALVVMSARFAMPLSQAGALPRVVVLDVTDEDHRPFIGTAEASIASDELTAHACPA